MREETLCAVVIFPGIISYTTYVIYSLTLLIDMQHRFEKASRCSSYSYEIKYKSMIPQLHRGVSLLPGFDISTFIQSFATGPVDNTAHCELLYTLFINEYIFLF